MGESQHILIVEDSPTVAEACRAHLRRLDADGVVVETLAAARAALRERAPDLVLLDVRLPDGDGLSLLPVITGLRPPPPVVVMTAHGSVATAVEAMRAGASDFLVKPFDGPRLLTTVRNALEQGRLKRLVRSYEEGFREEGFHGMIGRSLAMQAVYRMIESAAPSQASVFITGESGTGKELAAEALHGLSPRAGRPFVALNCAAIPQDLMESEIFGHRRGAFTGATAERAGAALSAHGGTLFLDEVCELDPALQGKLLRFLQTGAIRPVGADETVKVDVRIIAATNRDPLREVEAGRFREDLYYRLHVIPIHLPPLRERGEDVLLLARHFLRQYAVRENKAFRDLAEDACAWLTAHSWPGNVRELQNVLQQAVVLHDGELLTADMLPSRPGAAATAVEGGAASSTVASAAPTSSRAGREAVRPLWQVEREAIEHALAACDGSVPKAAALLEVSPSTLYRKLQSWEEGETETQAGSAGTQRRHG